MFCWRGKHAITLGIIQKQMQGSYITTYCAKNTLEGLLKISFMVNVMLIISTYQSLLKIPILAHIIYLKF